MPYRTLFEKLHGHWKGVCKTWFEPEILADESAFAGTFTPVFDGNFIRHCYQGTIQNKPRLGEEWIGFNSVTKMYQSSWIDSFHMSNAIMFSQGKPLDQGFEVRGDYDVAINEPRWGWRTTFQLIDHNHLVITAYNISPEGSEAMALETTLHRAQSSA